MSKLLNEKPAQEAEKKQVNGVMQKPYSTGKTTRQIIHRHLQDKNDMITEEDFKNLNTEPDLFVDPAYQPLHIPDDIDPSILLTPLDLINKSTE